MTAMALPDVATEVERFGLGYRMRQDADGDSVELMLGRLRTSAGEVKGELTVRLGDRHVSRGTYNLSSLRSRAEVARALGMRSSRVPWLEVLERFTLATLDAERTSSGVQMVGQRVPSVEHLRCLGPMLPLRQTSSVFAPPGAGKSTLARAVAVSMSTGQTVIPNWEPARAMQVLALDYETTAEEWSNGLAAIAEGAGIEPPSIPYLHGTRSLADSIETVAQAISEHGAEILIVDSVGLALGAGRDGGGAEETTLRMHAALRELRVTSLLIDQVAGSELHAATNGTSKPYGSVFKLYAARDAWELRRETEPANGCAEFVLCNVKVNDGPRAQPIELRVVYDDNRIRFEAGKATAPELETRLSTAERMARMLAQGALPIKELAAQLGTSDNAVRVTLGRHPERFLRIADNRIGLKSW